MVIAMLIAWVAMVMLDRQFLTNAALVHFRFPTKV